MATITRTVVFTDLANYAQKVSRTDRAGLRRILAYHQQLVAPIVKRYNGRVVKNLGDSFMILFESATDAVRAAIEVQENVTGDSAGTSIRLAMTTGDVEEIDGDAFGDTVNLAARILAKTPSGEIWFGAGCKVCMISKEIPWDTVGIFPLKGIAGGQEIFRAVPRHRAWLPDAVGAAAKFGTLVRIQRGQRPPLLPPDPVVLLEGFVPGSQALDDAVGSLPVLNPSALWLCAYNVSESDRQDWIAAGRGLVIGTPSAIDAAVDEALKASTRSTGSDTIVLDVGTNAEFELVMCGLALPQVPLHDVVASYSYDLLPDGRWVNRSDRAMLRIDVTGGGLQLEALAPGVSVDGRAVQPGDGVAIGHGARIATSQGVHRFHGLPERYHGIITKDSDMRLGVAGGQTAELGREPNHPGLAFPDRRGQENIRWCAGPKAARARAGGFTLDRALAGRRQAAIQVVGEAVNLMPLHARCPTYLLRPNGAVERAEGTVSMSVDDLIVAGTTVVGLRALGR